MCIRDRQKEEREHNGVLDCETEVVSGLTAYGPGSVSYTHLNAYAISICHSEGIASPTVVGAQAANELLDIRGVKASFVLTEYQNKLFFSARSIDEVNVQAVSYTHLHQRGASYRCG